MKPSIRLKVVIFTSCVVFLVGGSISFYSIFQGRQRIIRDFEMEAVKITSVISEIIANDLYLVDLLSLRRRLRGASVNPGISSTYVTDSDGVVLSDGTGENPLRGQKPSDAFSQKILRSNSWISSVEGGTLKVGGPVLMPDGSRIGYIQVGFSLGPAEESVREVTRTSFYITLICLAVGVFLAFILATSFTRPILAIVQAAKEIGAGKLDTRLPVKRTDELGVLAISTNLMAEALQRRQAETERSLEGIRALHEIDMAITSTLDIHAVLEVLLEKIDLFLPYSVATVRLFNKKSGLLEPVACRNLDEKEWKIGEWKAGRGPANAVFETKAPMMIRNCYNDPRVKDPDFFRRHQLVSYLGVPMVAKEEPLGVLSFYTKEEHEYTSEEVEFLTTLAGQAAIAIHNARLYEEAQTRETQLQETNSMLSALHAVAAAASQSLDLDRVLQAAIEKITEVLSFDATQIHIYNERTEELSLGAFFEKELNRFASVRSFKKGQGIVGKVAESGNPLIFEDVQTDPLYRQLSRSKISGQFGYHFFAVFPIKGKVKTLGTLACTGVEPRKLNSGEIQLLEALTDQIAVAIENSGLYEEVRERIQELQKRTAELERANKVKDEFLSVMSHELRTPLNVVMGYTGMIRDGILGEINAEQGNALEKVISRARDQLTMITSILQAVQLEAGELVVEEQAVGLGDLLNELKLHYDIPSGKEITLIWDYPVDLPVINSDGDKLKHILKNLINNAIKFTSRGSVTISARPVEKRGGADGQGGRGDSPQRPSSSAPMLSFVEFKVTDTGVGIPEEALPVIFERFRQVDSSETRLYGGVGIGLYIAKRFTEMLGGKVEVESEVGKGSTFTVTIPCESQQAERERRGDSLAGSAGI